MTEVTPTFSQVVKESRRWPHGSPNHQRAMQALYGLYRSSNGYHCAGFGQHDRLWDWVDTVEGSTEVNQT